MKVHLWALGAPSDEWVASGESLYRRRIERYLPFEYKSIQVSKSKVKEQVLAGEAKYVQQHLEGTSTYLILLDEKGPEYTSIQFSKKLEQWRQGTHKRVIFLIGSSYGFDPTVYQRSNELLGMSKMTLPHQLCRLLMLEQLYRACTILHGESYHHI